MNWLLVSALVLQRSGSYTQPETRLVNLPQVKSACINGVVTRMSFFPDSPACNTHPLVKVPYLLVFFCLFGAIGTAGARTRIDDGIERDASALLGISSTFGRWTSTINLVYDPDGAPARFADSSKVVGLINEAIGQWELVSGVNFVMTGVDASAPDDDFPGAKADGLIRIFWGDAGGAAGRAGPNFGPYDTALGYYPYEDGDLELNQDDSIWDSDFELVNVLVHEMGHVLGLGHSENPGSIMYADPYNFLAYPREDDIRAVQVLYGAPAVPLDPAKLVSDWVYKPPAESPASVTQYLFKANQFVDKNAFISAGGGNPITSLDASASDSNFVRLNTGGLGNFNNSADINIAATLIAVDPSGYVYTKRDWQLTCDAGKACGGGFFSFAETAVIKTIPGTWVIYVVDEAANHLLLSLSLLVDTTTSYNKAPTGSVSVTAAGQTSATFTLSAQDAENHLITAIWHPPGVNDRDGDKFIDTEVRQIVGDSGSVSQTVDFSQAGTHTLYLEIIDNGPRYVGTNLNSAGDGYQTLLRLEVTVPVTSASSLVATSTVKPAGTTGGNPAGGTASDVVAGTITGKSEPAQLITGTAAGSGEPVLRIGASANDGSVLGTTFTAGNTVVIAGSVAPPAVDIGKAGEIFMVIRTVSASGETWSYRNLDGIYVPWSDGKISSLEPAYEVSSLQADQSFTIFSGKLVAAEQRIYIGYMLQGSGALYYNGIAHKLNITD
jgi:hypothetical protein